MKHEDLIKEGLSEDQAKKVLELHKSAIDGNYVPKATFEAERTKVKERDQTIADRDKQISELGAFKGDNEALKTKVEELTEANKAKESEYQAKISQMETENAITLAIHEKVFNVADVLPKIDVSKLTIKDGEVTGGLSDQLEAIKKDNAHYFKPDTGTQGENSGLPGGWSLFGQPPAESNGGSSGSGSANNIGSELAKQVVQSSAVMQKASETYFQ